MSGKGVENLRIKRKAGHFCKACRRIQKDSETIRRKKKMKKPVLVVMAAGMGSRYGGLKQIDPVDEYGHIIMDFSVDDAVRAGFEKVVFVIKRENEADFRAAIGDRLAKQVEVAYVFQELTNLPEGIFCAGGSCETVGHRSCDRKLRRRDRRTVCCCQCRRLLRQPCVPDGIRVSDGT